MDRHKCKLCFRSFANGRALGGHMRSHMMNLPLSKPEDQLASSRTIQLSFEAESASSSSSSSSSSSDEEDDEKGLCYGLRENPKRSIRLVDPDFSLPPADTASVILHDRESESESFKNNPTLRRSKRPWNNNNNNNNNKYDYFGSNGINNNTINLVKKQGLEFESEAMIIKKSKIESCVDHEPASSVSDATTEEDVAFCLMMLSRDKWKKPQPQFLEDQREEEDDEDDEDEDEAFEESEESQETMKLCKNRVRGRYKCETCNKVFRSYQALGGHRASHKKIKVNVKGEEAEVEHNRNKSGTGTCGGGVVEKKIHECPVCFRVFASGQALGGHKRTHVTGSATVPSSSTKFGNSFIDLNLPAPIDEDDVSQIENSAVSDAEFVKTH